MGVRDIVSTLVGAGTMTLFLHSTCGLNLLWSALHGRRVWLHRTIQLWI